MDKALEVRSGLRAFRIDGLDPTRYAVPCWFLGDRDVTPAGPVPPGRRPRTLLQPFPRLGVLTFSAEKAPASVGAPHGEWIVEKR